MGNIGAKLKDIKDIVEVGDYSMYYLLAYILLAILIFVVIFYILTKPRRRKKPTNKEMALTALKSMNYDNSKETAYGFTLNIPFFITDENKKEIEDILEKLEIYKYKREIPQMDSELKDRIKKAVKGLKC